MSESGSVILKCAYFSLPRIWLDRLMASTFSTKYKFTECFTY
ncbi:hypothetical protein PsAD37_01717 [Pseudovibrio sp. Ad37]|nr:hypothetical protein PsAD37_01717 [Pseudovibrio sp. Ad37]